VIAQPILSLPTSALTETTLTEITFSENIPPTKDPKIVKVSLVHSNSFTEQDGPHRQLIEQVFAQLEQYQLQLMPPITLARSYKSLKAGLVDGIVNIISNDNIDGCITDPMFFYFNVIVVSKHSGINLHSLQDLANKSVSAFPRARLVMGKQFAALMASNSNYNEPLKQQQQARLLVQGIADVSVGDLHIFIHSLKKYNQRRSPEQQLTLADFTFYRLKNVSVARMAFTQQQLCDDVNQVIQRLKLQRYQDVLTNHYHEFDLSTVAKLK